MIVDDIKLIQGDCLEVMKDIPDKSVDMICCDLPYGVLNKGNKYAQWDKSLPLDILWNEYKRVIKDNGAIALFAQGMFTAKLMMSNEKLWRYNLVWDKQYKTGHLNAKRMPLRQHEDIVIFYKSLPVYNPQMIKSELHGRNHTGKNRNLEIKRDRCYGTNRNMIETFSDEKYPSSIITVHKDSFGKNLYHPTQKPVALLEYLIHTYSNEGETILDNTMGSGSTGVAAINTNRKFIGVELDKDFFNIAKQRILEAVEKRLKDTTAK